MKATSLNRKIQNFDPGERLHFHRYRLTNEQYHLCTEAVSSTALKDLYSLGNPRLCYERYIARSLPNKRTDALTIGSATHKLILEYRSFKKEFAVWEHGRRAGSHWQEFKLQHEDKEILTLDQYDDIRRMRDAVMRHPEANKLLSGGQAEESVFWRDEETGVLCRARADYKKIVNGSTVLIDLKTTLCAQPQAFTRDLLKLNYPLQEAMYRQGFEAQSFAFICVEKGDFNTVEVYDLDDLFDQVGYLIYRQTLEKWAEHLASNKWPTYRGGISTLECPEWYAAKIL